MALTLTEVTVMPGTGNKRMAIWKVSGDGTSYQINVADLKMSKVEAAWTENISALYKLIVQVENYDYVDGPVSIIELGDEGGNVLENGKEHLLFVVGY
jgi:hypothetical protein